MGWSMALCSRRLARRSITAATIGWVSLGLLPSCASNTHAVAGPTTTSQSMSASGEARLGCGTYCQSAGIVNGEAGSSGRPALSIVSGSPITADADGYVPVTLTCNLPVQCRGVISVEIGNGPDGKSDLVLDAGAVRTFGVRLSAQGFASLQSRGRISVLVIADSGPSLGIDTENSPPGTTAHGFNPLVAKEQVILAPRASG